MKVLKLLFVLLAALSAKGQELNPLITVNENGLSCSFTDLTFDDDQNLYTILSIDLFQGLNDSSKYAVLNYPKGADTIYYVPKKRVFLLKLSPNGNLTRAPIEINDGQNYDMFHVASKPMIFEDGIFFSILRAVYSADEDITINGISTKVVGADENTNDAVILLKFNNKIEIERIAAYAQLDADVHLSFPLINDKPHLLISKFTQFANYSTSSYKSLLFSIGGNLSINFIDDLVNSDVKKEEFFNHNTWFSSSKIQSLVASGNNKYEVKTHDSIGYRYDRYTSIERNGKRQTPWTRIVPFHSNDEYGFVGNCGAAYMFSHDGSSIIPFIGQDSFSAQYKKALELNVGIYTDVISIPGSRFKTKWFLNTELWANYFYSSDSLSIFALVEDSFWYNGRHYAISDSNFIRPGLRTLCLFKWDKNDSFSFTPIINSYARLQKAKGELHNGSYFAVIEDCKIPDSILQDSITGFLGNPDKVIVGASIFSPPQEIPEIAFYQTNCSGGTLKFKSKDAEHYTVLIANDSIRNYPRPGKTYNYSPNYLLSSKLTNDVRILYQGPDTSLAITNLVSGRQYFIAVVPGNGLDGSTLYNPDSSAFVEFTLNSVFSKPKIYPKNDTALCTYDSIYAEANSSYTIRWMDGKSVEKRFVAKGDDFSYTIKDTSSCVLSSDTVNISFKPTPKIDSVFTLQKEPYCFGDTIDIEVATSGDIIWSNGSRDRVIRTDSSGLYRVSVRNLFGCSDSAELYLEINALPYFNFTIDSTISIDGEAEIEFNTNAFKTDFIYQDDTSASINYSFFESGLLRANALNSAGCLVRDSILINAVQSQTEIFPNAFSPNNDGVNDEWFFIHPDTAGTLMVFDKWGGKVYQGMNIWNGKKLGEALPIGAYRYTFIPNEGDVKRGLIFLMK